jgi:hypothetical protein
LKAALASGAPASANRFAFLCACARALLISCTTRVRTLRRQLLQYLALNSTLASRALRRTVPHQLSAAPSAKACARNVLGTLNHFTGA